MRPRFFVFIGPQIFFYGFAFLMGAGFMAQKAQHKLADLSPGEALEYVRDHARGWVFGTGQDRAKITRVVDGDTFVATINGKQTTVRLTGVDTPETVKPGTPVRCYGKAASRASKYRLSGRRVTLKYDFQRKDKYGRTLAYVKLSDGSDYGAWLVRKGYARALNIPPNTRHARLYRRLERNSSSGYHAHCNRSPF